MSVFDALPLLDGWTYVRYLFPELKLLKKRESAKVMHEPLAVGWVMDISYISTDCLMEFSLEFIVAGEKKEVTITPQDIHELGLTLPPPFGTYETLYIRPAPPSTAGTYVGSLITSAYPFPYKGPIRASIRLSEMSTQDEAAGNLIITVIKVTDVEALKRSYKELLASVPRGSVKR